MRYCPTNGHILVKPLPNTITFENNLVMQQEVDKKGIVRGTVYDAGDYERYEEKNIYYPFFAAIVFNIGGEQFHLLNHEDILMYEEE